MTTYWIMIDGLKVASIETKAHLDSIAQSKIMGVFSEMEGLQSLRGVSMRRVG